MSLDVQLRTERFEEFSSPLLVVPFFTDNTTLPEELTFLEKHFAPSFSNILVKPKFEAKLNQTRFIYTRHPNWPLLVLVGAGKINEWDLEKARQVWGKAIAVARELKLSHLAIFWGKDYPVPHDFRDFLPEVVAALCTAAFRVKDFITHHEEEPPEVQRVDVLLSTTQDLELLVRQGLILGESVNFTRRLGDYPANLMNPEKIMEEARHLAGEYNWDLEVLDETALEARGLNALMAVARGSENPTYLVIASYSHPQAQKTVGLVGKGVTFDTGGISIKPSKNMEEMKYDMCGAAAVLGALKAVSETQLPVNVVAALPLVENMPSGKATRPGDIVKSYSGKTIEIINTDAEGRLILADALSYVEKNYQPDYLIDLATLTGAAIVALGHLSAAALTTSEELLDLLEEAANISGERIWQLPLWDDYKELLKSKIADVRNIATKPEAGVITAAMFLKTFVEKTPWTHLDIAGTAWAMPEKTYRPAGATGFGVRLLWHFLARLTEE